MRTSLRARRLGCILGGIALLACGDAVRAVAQQAAKVLPHKPISATAKYLLVKGVATPTAYIVATPRPLWTAPLHAGDTIRYDADIANNGPAQATLVGVGQQTTNLTVQSFAAECTPLPCYVAYPSGDVAAMRLMAAPMSVGGPALVRLLPNGDHLLVHVTATVNAPTDFSATVAVQTQTPKDERSVLQAQFSGTAEATPQKKPPPAPPPTPTPPPPPPADPQLSVTADLTPAGPYQSGQGVLLVIDVTNVGGSPAEGVTVVNEASNLHAQPLWGGCETAPCPAFTLAALEQRQITVPATVIDAGAAIDDTVTVSAPGEPDQTVPIHIAAPPPSAPPPPAQPPTPPTPGTPTSTPRPPPMLWIALGTAAVLTIAWIAYGQWRAAQRRRWLRLISASATADTRGVPSTPFLPLSAPPISVRASLAPGEARANGPIPMRRIT